MKEKRSYTPKEVLEVVEVYAALFTSMTGFAISAEEGKDEAMKRFAIGTKECLKKYNELPQNLRRGEINTASGKSAEVLIAELEVMINEEFPELNKP